MHTWSPSQSDPLMVSYACHLQSSSDMFPRAALIPPWAATVCDLVGKSFVMHLQVNTVFSTSPALRKVSKRPKPDLLNSTSQHEAQQYHVYLAVNKKALNMQHLHIATRHHLWVKAMNDRCKQPPELCVEWPCLRGQG